MVMTALGKKYPVLVLVLVTPGPGQAVAVLAHEIAGEMQKHALAIGEGGGTLWHEAELKLTVGHCHFL